MADDSDLFRGSLRELRVPQEILEVPGGNHGSSMLILLTYSYSYFLFLIPYLAFFRGAHV